MKKMLVLTGLTVAGLVAFGLTATAQQGNPDAAGAGQGLGNNCQDYVDENNSGVCDNWEAGGLGRGRAEGTTGNVRRGQGPGRGQGQGMRGANQGRGMGRGANGQGPGEGQGRGQGQRADNDGENVGQGAGGQAQGLGQGRGANGQGRGMGNRGNQNANNGQGRGRGWQPNYVDEDGDGVCDNTGQAPRQQAPRDGRGQGRGANR